MNVINLILDNPVYTLLFGSGGVLIVILTAIGIRRKRTDRGGDIRERRGISLTIEGKISKKEVEVERFQESYKTETLSASKSFVLVIESPVFKDNDVTYMNQSFRKEEFYLQFLKSIEEKKKKEDKIKYE